MKIREVHGSSPDYTALQEYAARNGLVFHFPEWTEIYPADHFVHCVILNNNDEVTGCFFYYRFTKGFFRFSITAPFSPNVALYYTNPSESVVGKNSFAKELLSSVADYLKGVGSHHFHLSLPDTIVDTQPFTWAGFTSKTRYSYLINLQQSEEALWANLSSEKRKSINKAKKDNLEVAETTDYSLVYSLIHQSLSRNDKAKNLNVIKNILGKFSGTGRCFSFVAMQEGTPIGATFCVIAGGRAIYIFGGFDAGNKHHGAGVSCMWESILKARRLGLEYFDFEGSMNVSIERYFREFGGKLTPYFCIERTAPLLSILFYLKKVRSI